MRVYHACRFHKAGNDTVSVVKMDSLWSVGNAYVLSAVSMFGTVAGCTAVCLTMRTMVHASCCVWQTLLNSTPSWCPASLPWCVACISQAHIAHAVLDEYPINVRHAPVLGIQPVQARKMFDGQPVACSLRQFITSFFVIYVALCRAQ